MAEQVFKNVCCKQSRRQRKHFLTERNKAVLPKTSEMHIFFFIWLEISSVKMCLHTFLVFLLSFYWDGTREKFMHRPSSPSWGRIKETRSYCRRNKAQSASRRPLIGVYHLVWGGWYVGLGRGGLGLTGSSTSSGIFTTAFLAFSSLAPSSVDPLSPQRTFKTMGKHLYQTHSVLEKQPLI